MPRLQLFWAASTVILIASTNLEGAKLNDERVGPEETVRKYEHACEQFDFTTANSLLMSDARWIEDSYPEPAKFTGQGWSKHWNEMKEANVQLHYQIRDLETHVRGEVAWVTLSLDTIATADTPEAIKINGNVHEWRGTFVESYVLVKPRGDWKVALGHTSLVPATSGASGK
jgi:ketosteroid isomerase-like protein